MRRRIRLTESDLHRIVRESVKRILKEVEEYDWDYPEEDLPFIKKAENDASWHDKKIGDDDARDATQIWDIQGFPQRYRYGDGSQIQHGSEYDNGYEDMYGNRDVNDEYFKDSDYEFKYDGWGNDDTPNLMNRHEEFRGGYI